MDSIFGGKKNNQGVPSVGNVCNAECQDQNKKTKLYNDFVNAKNVHLKSKETLDKAEANYYTKTGQTQVYNNIIRVRATNEIAKQIDKIKEGFDEDVKNLQTKIKYINSQSVIKKNINDVKDNWFNKKEAKKKQAQATTWQRRLDDRMANFYNDKNESLSYWSNNILFYLYWILFVLIFIVLILKKQYKKIENYPFILCMLILPFMIHPIYSKILGSLKHLKLDNIYLMFIMFALFLFITFFMAYKVSFRTNVPE